MLISASIEYPGQCSGKQEIRSPSEADVRMHIFAGGFLVK